MNAALAQAVPPGLAVYHEIIEGLHRFWTPHSGQVEIIRSIFGEGYEEVFAECGRNFGKTDVICYALWRTAKSCPYSPNYYFAPFAKQGGEIIWEPQRLQTFGPAEWIVAKNETEMRLTFDNGAFIKCDGSDNTEAYRGVKITGGGLVVLDEFKDFKPDFWIAMEPNLIDAKLLITGTPPEIEGQFWEVADEFKANPRKKYINLPSSCNPHLKPDFLPNKKRELYAKGEGDVWEREYEAKRVKGGKNSIFPMVHSYPVIQHETLIEEIRRIRHKLEWFCIADPGTTSTFAVLYIALNRYTKTVYFLDEIYEQNQAETSVSRIGPRIIATQKELAWQDRDEKTPVDWFNVCDEAAAWFINEMGDQHKVWFGATKKAAIDKDTGLSTMKDGMLKAKFKFSSRCKKLRWEMEKYIKDDKGRIPKVDDHLIDDVRYFLQAAGYSLVDEAEPIPESQRENFRGARIQDDFPEYFDEEMP